MHRSDIHHSRAQRIRRSIGASGMLLSAIIIISLAVYTYDMRSSLVATFGRHSTSPSGVGTIHAASTCKTPAHAIGSSNETITSSGLRRSFIVHLPPSYGNRPQPLVINYHAFSFTAQHMAGYTNMGTEADNAGFIVVFPQGVDTPPSWNAGLGAQGPTGSTDDIQFTRDLLHYLESNYCVDTHRIYATGFSLGGGMAYRIACTLTDQFAAIATVAGAYYHAPGGCQPARPIPILEIHGQADRFAPYTGNPAAGMAAVQVYLNVWLDHDRCSGAGQVFFQQGDVTGIEWTHCANGTSVVHYRVSDGDHTWPGATFDRGLGFTTHVIDANVVIWNFFSHYST